MIFVIDSGIAGDIGGLACLKAGRKICKCRYRVSNFSMTQHLSHTIAHFRGPSSLIKKFGSCVHLCKFRQKMASILENKVCTLKIEVVKKCK